jgi:hypothetical protein
MLPENTLAIVARNERWAGEAATEPYECGWAREAVFFVRALEAEGIPDFASAQVQVSPDGMHWADEGTSVLLPRDAGDTDFAKVSHFGGWLRLAVDLPEDASMTVVVSLHLKA